MEENMMVDSALGEKVAENSVDWVKEMKKSTASIGWKYALFSVVVIVLQILYGILLPESLASKSWATWLQIIIPMHLVGFAVLSLLIRNMPKVTIEKKKLGFGKFILCVFIGAGICFVGAIIGMILNFALTLPFGVASSDTNSLGNLMLSSDAGWRILTVGICAPIFEELFFRKFLIDRVAKYGEFLAIMLSGLMFGMFHGNFQQVFFAAGLGMFWAFIYLKTGKIWYTIAMHMVINLSTSVITVFLAQSYLEYMDVFMDPDYMANVMNGDPNVMAAVISLFAFLGWMGILGIFALVGIVLFFVNIKKFRINPSPYGITKGQVFGKGIFNWGMILFWLVCLFLFVQYYGSIILAANM